MLSGPFAAIFNARLFSFQKFIFHGFGGKKRTKKFCTKMNFSFPLHKLFEVPLCWRTGTPCDKESHSATDALHNVAMATALQRQRKEPSPQLLPHGLKANGVHRSQGLHRKNSPRGQWQASYLWLQPEGRLSVSALSTVAMTLGFPGC